MFIVEVVDLPDGTVAVVHRPGLQVLDAIPPLLGGDLVSARIKIPKDVARQPRLCGALMEMFGPISALWKKSRKESKESGATLKYLQCRCPAQPGSGFQRVKRSPGGHVSQVQIPWVPPVRSRLWRR